MTITPRPRSGGSKGASASGSAPARRAGGPREKAASTKADSAKYATKQEEAYEYIRRRMLAGIYAPGQRLIIDALARELEISQVPIREAIRKLEAEGWVVYPKGTGPMVAFIGRAEWAQSMELLAVLEGYATALAAATMTRADIAQLRSINKALRSAYEAFDLAKLSESNREFHTAIYSRCPNPAVVDLETTTRRKLDAIRGTLFFSVPQRGARSVQEHEELIEAIASKASFAEIEHLARQHKLNFIAAAVAAIEAREKSLEMD